MGGPSGMLGTKTNPDQVALVAQNAPNVAANRRVVAPVAPLAAFPFSSSRRFERTQRFS